jgi:hypothetical protein
MHDLLAEVANALVQRRPLRLFIRGLTGRLAVTIVACLSSIVPVGAADFKDGFGFGEIVLEGTITPGDYDKLLNFVEANPARSIYLASPGGSMTEGIEIGRLVRALKLETIVPDQLRGDVREKVAERHNLTNPKENYMCSSACFFVFVAGVERDHEWPEDPLLGVHRPYLSGEELRALSGDEAMRSATQLRAVVGTYLKEMSVPAKYVDLMFSVPKDEIRWISRDEFEADLEGFVPELKDWVEARCDTRTDVEKTAWAALKNKSPAQMTAAEKSISEMLEKKMSRLDQCGSKALGHLSDQAQRKMFWGPRKFVPCDETLSDVHLDAKLAVVIPNEASASALRDEAQNANLCGDSGTAKRIIRALAERGDAVAQLSLGAAYLNSDKHASHDSIPPDKLVQDKLEGVKWFLRAANQGNLDAQDLLIGIFFVGDGVPQNNVEALKWVKVRASLNKDKKDTSLHDWDFFISKMTSQQIEVAQRLASQWQPTPEGNGRNFSGAPPTKSKSPWWQFWN